MNHGDLKALVASYLNRSDLSSYIPFFISFAERRIAYGSDGPNPSEPLRVPAMQARESGTISSSAIAYPTRFLEVIRLKGVDGTTTWPIDYASPSQFSKYENSVDSPSYYTFLNNQIEVAGSRSVDYVLDYYQAFTALSTDSDTNWLLTNAPDAYLFGALLESAPFIVDMTMIPAWSGMYKSTISALNRTTLRPASGSLYVRAA